MLLKIDYQSRFTNMDLSYVRVIIQRKSNVIFSFPKPQNLALKKKGDKIMISIMQ